MESGNFLKWIWSHTSESYNSAPSEFSVYMYTHTYTHVYMKLQVFWSILLSQKHSTIISTVSTLALSIHTKQQQRATEKVYTG